MQNIRCGEAKVGLNNNNIIIDNCCCGIVPSRSCSINDLQGSRGWRSIRRTEGNLSLSHTNMSWVKKTVAHCCCLLTAMVMMMILSRNCLPYRKILATGAYCSAHSRAYNVCFLWWARDHLREGLFLYSHLTIFVTYMDLQQDYACERKGAINK